MFKLLILNIIFFSALVSGNYSNDIERPFAYANNKIVGEFQVQYAKRYPGQYGATAIYPLLSAAGLMALSTKGKTREEFLDFINLPNNEVIEILYPRVRKTTFDKRLVGSPTLSLFVYTDKDNKFCPDFSYTYNKTFGGKTRVIDYGNPKKAADEINEEIKNTAYGFKNIISEKAIKKGPGIIFASSFKLNILYNEKRFKYTTKSELNFKDGKKVVKLPAVTGMGLVRYKNVKYLDAKVIETEGKGGLYTYLMIFPNKYNGLPELLQKLNNPTTFSNILDGLKDVCAKLTIPYGDMSTKIDLGKSLKDSKYLTRIFKEGGLELCGVSQKKNTYVSSILHEVLLKPGPMYENSRDVCTDYEIEMKADRPHLFYVTFSKKSGRVTTPVVASIFDFSSY